MRSILFSMSCIALLASCGQASNDTASAHATRTPATTPASTAPAATIATATTLESSAIAAANPTDAAAEADNDSDMPHTAMQLTPLSKDDIALYLQVMHAAADRVQHPTAADTAMLARYKTLMAAADTNKAMVASVADSVVTTDATMHALQMDVLVVRERHLDEKRYNGISSVIEDVVPNPTVEAVGSATGEGAPTDQPKLSDASLALQQKIKSVETQDATILAPHRAEIQQVLGVVRNMRRLQ